MIKLQESTEFIEDFFQEAEKAEKSIWIETMFFEPGPLMERFETLLISAKKRGLDVRFRFDWVTETYFENNLRLYPQLNKKWSIWKHVEEKRKQLLQRLIDAGIDITVTNKPSLLGSLIPMAGRNHIKIFSIDEKVAWIGGVNLSPELEGKDIMIKCTDKKMVLLILQQFTNANKNEKNDKRYHISDCYDLLIDVGIYGESIIFDEALTMIQSAKKQIVIVSQFVPDFPTIHILQKKSLERCRIVIITGDKHFDLYKKFPSNIFYLLLKQTIKRYKNIQLLHYPGKVHAKILLVDTKTALLGSHNLVWSGVILGTKEIGIKTTDKALVKEVGRFTKELIKKAELPE